ncbi:uncharacterized protein [Neodiprion pinetum]|uniref:uncharacterized protein n=1 Tax=Neodiprion pinetum TaxID=441929 RepID=UPI001EDE4E10|nr:uncharacterized protein LOC124216894 [Neodiprion pinetum]
MIGKLLLAGWILQCLRGLHGDLATRAKWPTALEEAYDERNDREIFQAVVQSMREWEAHKKHNRRLKRDVSRVCYEDVGCFEDTGPFGYLEMLPSPPKDVGTRFLVYGSRKARSIPMDVPAEDIADKAFQAIDSELPTKVIVHGFGSSCDHVWVYEMRSALMSVHECNIVCVDWGPGSAVPNYVRAAANTRLVGRQLAKLVRQLNVPLERVHLIGFSLGAHVAGFAGAELGNVSRITGLDPAGPLFEAQDPRARLDATDASFVDVIHSNGEQLILGGLGSWQPMGDVDFYPNGGRMQTGCSNLFLGAVSDIIWSSAVEGRSLCNHRRAYKLFTDSVSPRCRFPAFPCDHGYDGLIRGDCFPCGVNGAEKPCGDMGYYSDESTARGQLYLVTRDEEPFCAHQYQIKLYNSRGERPARSYGKLQISLIGQGALNETFTMTRKDDEELLIGAILQKIVVPHPAVSDLEAIEVKYTAYSGWISSGLVSWSIDKVSIIDSFGNSLSVCRRGLILESNHPVYLPLYPGECNIPAEPETTAIPQTTPYGDQQFAHEKKGGIGPFTKDQNFEKDGFLAEVISEEMQTRPQKGLGPFTKDQNPKPFDKEAFTRQDIFSNAKKVFGNDIASSESSSQTANPWTVADLADGDSNSLENVEVESGRGFSESTSLQVALTATNSPRSLEQPTTNLYSEIREPVLKLFGKESGRSLKLPEITEPILRPRPARQNEKSNGIRRSGRGKLPSDPVKDTASRSFTVQFLPERLAGILAHAERYARQTLLPLISQYTPSFVGGPRYNQPTYFPPLGDIVNERLEDSNSREIVNSERNSSSVENDSYEEEDSSRVDNSRIGKTLEAEEVVFGSSRDSQSYSDELTSGPAKTEMDQSVESLKVVANLTEDRPENATSGSQETGGSWLTEDGTAWSKEDAGAGPETKIDDWVPIVPADKEVLEKPAVGVTPPVIDGKDDRKFIPLIDFANPDEYFVSSTSKSVGDVAKNSTAEDERLNDSTTIQTSSHIQKIPGRSNDLKEGKTTPKSVINTVFPYIYERKNDPRTRYIPLLPEEDMRPSGLG